MFNLDQLQKRLQSPGVTDQHLIFYVQNPNGQVPSVMALAELKRRQELRASKTPQEQAQNMMQPTVADKVISQDTQANIGPDFRSQGLPAVDQQMQAQKSMGQGISNLPLPETMYDEKNFASGGIVAFDDGGDVDLTTRAQFMPSVRRTDPLSNEESEVMKAQYLLGADFGNDKASVGADYAGNIDARGIANPRLNEVQGRYMTDQGDQYSARYNPDARYVGVDRQSGRTSVGADVAPGPDNSMGLRSIRGSYITDNGTRYGAGYNVDSRQALLERINQEGNSLGFNVSPDSVGVQGQYGFAQGGEVKHYVGGDLVQTAAPAEDLSGLSLSDLTPEQYSRLTTEQLANLQQIEGDRQRLGRLGKGTLGAVTAPYQIGAYGLEKAANAVGAARIGKALGIYGPNVKSVRMPRVGISDLTKPLDVSKEALAKEVAQNAKNKKLTRL